MADFRFGWLSDLRTHGYDRCRSTLRCLESSQIRRLTRTVSLLTSSLDQERSVLVRDKNKSGIVSAPVHRRRVITTERSEKTSSAVVINLFAAWHKTVGLKGCSSHSGRRTFITNAARKISTVGGSLRDVQMLAGHKALSTTQRYIEADVAAQRRVVDLV